MTDPVGGTAIRSLGSTTLEDLVSRTVAEAREQTNLQAQLEASKRRRQEWTENVVFAATVACGMVGLVALFISFH